MGGNRHGNFLKLLLELGLLCVASMLVLVACSKQEPIKIGFVGCLTGRGADLGISGRNGVILAVEEVNNAGGIHGRKVNLVTKDDQQNAEIALKVDNELVAEKVVAIIGHMTSAMSVVGVPVVNRHKVLMLSPTTSTNELNDKDDYFFRVYPASVDAAKKLAIQVYKKNGYKKITVVYDYSNRAHTENWFHTFENTFKKLGGTIVAGKKYSSSPITDFLQLSKELIAVPTDCLLILANGLDTAMFCQQLLKLQANLPIIASEWSATEDVLRYGGKSVEGVKFYQTFNQGSTSAKFLRFKESFINRFSETPGFAAVHAYDSARIVFKALQKDTDPARIRQTIINIGTFEGLQGELTFNSFGDIQRNYFFMTIKDGQFTASDKDD